MHNKSIWLLVSLVVMVVMIIPQTGFSNKKDRVARDFRKADINGDNKISLKEWNRRGNFQRLDNNSDGFLSLREVRRIYKGHDKRNYSWPPKGMTKYLPGIDETVQRDRVDKDVLNKETICGIARLMKCKINPQINRGLLATGTGPRFPENVICPGIDDYWAMDYAFKRNRITFHGGIDIPVPWGTPIRSVAKGSVVAMFKADQSKRGNEVVLRHSPEQTGLPMWTYSAYGHLDALPKFKIGQRLKMGDIIGPTGNSGIAAKGKKGSAQSKTRRPAIHLAMFYSLTPQYSEVKATIVPVNGYWLDPMAFYRQKEPFESKKVKDLPESEKSVAIPVLLEDGTTIPSDTKIIWPYSGRRD
ncbi:MAG: peptidoglycan DD-metalloendopeptidase family protein [Desulfobacteraceae bacterium]|nr:peptidoglycan DD-metalloendopeptidase family protein [Desulfobacteraceae bacterium]